MARFFILSALLVAAAVCLPALDARMVRGANPDGTTGNCYSPSKGWYMGNLDSPSCDVPVVMCDIIWTDGYYHAWTSDGSFVEINPDGIMTVIFPDGSAITSDYETGEVLVVNPTGTFITGGKMVCGEYPVSRSAQKSADSPPVRLSKLPELKPKGGAPKGEKMNMAFIDIAVAGKQAAASELQRGREVGAIVKQEAMSIPAADDGDTGKEETEEDEGDDKLSKGELGGMIAGIVLFALFVALVCVFLFVFRAGAKKEVTPAA